MPVDAGTDAEDAALGETAAATPMADASADVSPDVKAFEEGEAAGAGAAPADDAPAPTPGEAVLARLVAAGATPVTPPVLQPAAPFLQRAGEELAKRIYLTRDPMGEELCLRPEFTIPLTRHYLDRETVGARAMYAYHGTVFRDRGGVGEFPQGGVELFGDDEAEEADARLLKLALDCTGLDAPLIHLGDVELFETFLKAIALPAAFEGHIRRRFSRADDLAAEIAALRDADAPTSPLASLLAAAPPETARVAVDEMLRLAGGSGETVAGRTSTDIAERYVERALVRSAAGLEAEKVDLLLRYLRVDASPWEALDALEAIAREGRLALNGALDDFARRLGLMADEGVDLYEAARFSTAFGRRIDYYTGLVFEAHDPARPEIGPLAAGGRYDGLVRQLGAGTDVPAVGFAVWIERLEAAA